MNVSELITQLSNFPPHTPVVIEINKSDIIELFDDSTTKLCIDADSVELGNWSGSTANIILAA